LRVQAPSSLLPPVFCNLLGSLVQPVLVGTELDHFHSRKSFRRVWCRSPIKI
jgi:hypothetical protein